MSSRQHQDATAFDLQSLPLLCIDRVGELLCKNLLDFEDVPSAARVAAAMALVGNSIFSLYAERVFEEVLDPGCVTAKTQALASYARNCEKWTRQLVERDDGVPDHLGPHSKHAEIREVCRKLRLGVTGSKNRLWANIEAMKMVARDRFRMLERLLNTNDGESDEEPVIKPSSLRCPVRHTRRAWIKAWQTDVRNLDVDNTPPVTLTSTELMRRFRMSSESALNHGLSCSSTGRHAHHYLLVDVLRVLSVLNQKNDTKFLWSDIDGEVIMMNAYIESWSIKKRQAAQSRRETSRRHMLRRLYIEYDVSEKDVYEIPGGSIAINAFVAHPRKNTVGIIQLLLLTRDMVSRRDQLNAALEEVVGCDSNSDFIGGDDAIPMCKRFVVHGLGNLRNIVRRVHEAWFLNRFVNSTVKWITSSSITIGKYMSSWVTSLTIENDGDARSFLAHPHVPSSLLIRYMPAVALAYACSLLKISYVHANRNGDAESVMSCLLYNAPLQEFVSTAVGTAAEKIRANKKEKDDTKDRRICLVSMTDIVFNVQTINKLLSKYDVNTKKTALVCAMSRIQGWIDDELRTRYEDGNTCTVSEKYRNMQLVLEALSDEVKRGSFHGNGIDRATREKVVTILRSSRTLARSARHLSQKHFMRLCPMCEDIRLKHATPSSLQSHASECH